MQERRGNTDNGGSNKMCNFCDMKGQKESQCFKKNPEKGPEWWREKNGKAESVSSSVEVTLMPFGNLAKAELM